MSDQRFPLTYGYRGARRDRLVAGIASWIISTFASQGYNILIIDTMRNGREGVIQKMTAQERNRENDEP